MRSKAKQIQLVKKMRNMLRTLVNSRWELVIAPTHITTLGITNYTQNHIAINSFAICYLNEERCYNILLHEIAHVMAGYEANHGEQWKLACRLIGLHQADEYFTMGELIDSLLDTTPDHIRELIFTTFTERA